MKNTNATNEKVEWYKAVTANQNKYRAEGKLNAMMVVLEYRTDFASLIDALAYRPGMTTKPMYSPEFLTMVLECYLEKFSIKTVRRLVSTNERTWSCKGYRIGWDSDRAYKIIDSIFDL